VFLGEHRPRLDEKGRLFLPAKFRDELAEGLVITKGQEHCLYVFAASEFSRLATELAQAALAQGDRRGHSRVFFGSASDEVPDRQGRVTIPPVLREYAGLTKDCVVIGMNTRVEIWDSERWADYLNRAEPAFADAREEVLPGLV
jgi:MraZ protein